MESGKTPVTHYGSKDLDPLTKANMTTYISKLFCIYINVTCWAVEPEKQGNVPFYTINRDILGWQTLGKQTLSKSNNPRDPFQTNCYCKQDFSVHVHHGFTPMAGVTTTILKKSIDVYLQLAGFLNLTQLLPWLDFKRQHTHKDLVIEHIWKSGNNFFLRYLNYRVNNLWPLMDWNEDVVVKIDNST